MLRAIFSLFILLNVPNQVFAVTYYSGSSRFHGSVNPNDPFTTLFFFFVGIGALYFYWISLITWIKRKKVHEEPEPLYGIGDWLIVLGLYAMLSLFACMPVFEILSSIGGKELVRETWYLVFLGFFGLITFLRRT
ncbi:putative four-helix membrane protein [Acinetobacter haemolyticus]|uniref:putative four-helix membrane protein n=1 Tax=Acinetobacter haemolyticus TaxID=29430 RepID=UPI00325A9B05